MSDQGVPEMTPSAMKLAEPLSQMEARAKKLWDDCSNWPVGQFTHESWCRAYMEEALAKAFGDGQRGQRATDARIAANFFKPSTEPADISARECGEMISDVILSQEAH